MAEKSFRPCLTYADEAHRLNKKSGMFQNVGENQIKEIIYAAACSVFFIDESQRVTLSDINPVADTVATATFNGAAVDWYIKADDIVLKNKNNQNVNTSQNTTQQKK